MRRSRPTVSLASWIALVFTNKGCRTLSSTMFEMTPLRTFYGPGRMSARHGDVRYGRTHDSRRLLAVRMPVSQLGNHRDRVQASVLGERCGDDLERLGVRGEAVRLHPLERLRVLTEQT